MSIFVNELDVTEAPVLDMEPLSLSVADQAAIRDLVATSEIAVRAGHVYNRKGYVTADSFAGRPNPSYRTRGDAVVVQVTMFIPDSPAHRGDYQILQNIHASVQADVNDREVAVWQGEVARAAAELAAAQAELALAQTELALVQARLDAVRRG